MIKLTNIQKYYQAAGNQVHVLKSVDMHVAQGDFVGIIGASGSGKSTLINLLGFIDKQFEGEYQFEGANIRQMSDDAQSTLRNASVGFVFQNFSLVETLTLAENIELPLLYAGKRAKQVRKQVLAMLEAVGLKGMADKYPKQLSGGQQQRVAIARAMIHQPKFLIADEPTGALDSKTSQEIMALFEGLHQQGATIILVTHDMAMLKYCSKVYCIADGVVKQDDIGGER